MIELVNTADGLVKIVELIESEVDIIAKEFDGINYSVLDTFELGSRKYKIVEIQANKPHLRLIYFQITSGNKHLLISSFKKADFQDVFGECFDKEVIDRLGQFSRH